MATCGVTVVSIPNKRVRRSRFGTSICLGFEYIMMNELNKEDAYKSIRSNRFHTNTDVAGACATVYIRMCMPAGRFGRRNSFP